MIVSLVIQFSFMFCLIYFIHISLMQATSDHITSKISSKIQICKYIKTSYIHKQTYCELCPQSTPRLNPPPTNTQILHPLIRLHPFTQPTTPARVNIQTIHFDPRGQPPADDEGDGGGVRHEGGVELGFGFTGGGAED